MRTPGKALVQYNIGIDDTFIGVPSEKGARGGLALNRFDFLAHHG